MKLTKKKVNGVLKQLEKRIRSMDLDVCWTLGFLDHFHKQFFLDKYVMVVLKRSDKTYIFLATDACLVSGLWDAPERLKTDL